MEASASDPSQLQPVMKESRSVLARSLTLGQYVLVKPAEQIPVDGVVVFGTASLVMAHITGESHPVPVSPNDQVTAGSINTDGLLVVRVTAKVDDSTPARIARMAADAQSSKPKLQRTLDKVGQIWSKGVILISLLTLLILPVLNVSLQVI